MLLRRRKTVTLTSLQLEFNSIGNVGAVALAKNSTITSLTLGGNHQMGDTGTVALAKNSTLTSLHLYDNQINDTGAAAFKRNSTLIYLKLDIKSIGRELMSQVETSIIAACINTEP